MRERRFRPVLAALLAIGAFWLFGLVWFARGLQPPPASPEATDAIVVLTGGSERLAAGLDLLGQGLAQKLLVSGVPRGVGIADLVAGTGVSPETVACCVALGHNADNTIENAEETSAWLAAEGFRSLRLVTATYHMRRSLVVFYRAMPGVRIVPHPVYPAGFKEREWWRWPGTLSLTVSEYNKYLAAVAIDRLDRLAERVAP
jgi:uncharacterized SAM-binding protein YcdF (DUF218 family)